MADLQLWVGGRPVSEDEMATLAEHYPLTDSAMYLCRMGSTFQEPIDDDDATADEEDGSDEYASDDIGPGDGDTDRLREDYGEHSYYQDAQNPNADDDSGMSFDSEALHNLDT
ncbi:hypothetical protein H5410_040314 [Solanum commersonii]|uniref:Uncharacterized protein n=1 Tax=Solanum commersonii TaxID=4109 RepID=A0A9J5XRP9_SOLCO|nr:hypothetical protein H5410_040314 [Solanum commersonii]